MPSYPGILPALPPPPITPAHHAPPQVSRISFLLTIFHISYPTLNYRRIISFPLTHKQSINMFSSQISTIGFLVLQISMSARYGHAVDIEATSGNAESPAPLSASYMSAVETPVSTYHEARRSESVSAVSTGSVTSLRRGIKTRHVRSTHRNLKRHRSGTAGNHHDRQQWDVKQHSAAGNNTLNSTTVETPKAEAATTNSTTPTNGTASTSSTTTASSTSAASSTSTASSTSSSNSTTDTNTGEATYYGTGLGACGIVSTDTSMIAAASHLLFDSFPGATANPNENPICGRKVRATYQGKSVEVELVDRCEGCAVHDLDFSPSAFAQLGAMESGRLYGMTWVWV
ncbi:hypothetical protein PCASD_02185 [Puccinia coronata f. sp. avenae]|uniref:RlpA-like protein double-psi beta-barrel domain-containing protein n=1 Tax=Puccinia coronata f. sp. avenae TaxID=200324 RepID=A0A2N5VI40_9BASI|nr:hypothetical protein PCASD_02185 [Puccinia coronata f. sp. avenae]